MPWLRAARPSSSTPIPSSGPATRDGRLISVTLVMPTGLVVRPKVGNDRDLPLDLTSTSGWNISFHALRLRAHPGTGRLRRAAATPALAGVPLAGRGCRRRGGGGGLRGDRGRDSDAGRGSRAGRPAAVRPGVLGLPHDQ